jgi:hypothetical protein
MAIEIYNVVIQPETIIGVGPLVQTFKPEPVLGHKELRYQFDLYFLNYRTVITTDPLDQENSERELSRIRRDWEHLRENLVYGYPMDTGFSVLPKSMPGV